MEKKLTNFNVNERNIGMIISNISVYKKIQGIRRQKLDWHEKNGNPSMKNKNLSKKEKKNR